MEDPANYDSWRQLFHQHGPRLLLCARLWTRSLAAARIVAPRANGERRTEEESGNIEPLFEPPIEDRERLLVVETALHRLPSEQREVLVLKIWGQLTFE
jgi:RNA polymerase sigma-70 factor, ECF subfamily